MLIAMAGLPGAGKSTMAARLAAELGAVILNKDAVRAVLFPPPVLDYSAEQDDLCMGAIYAAAAHILRNYPLQAVILDGRTFLSSYQVRDLFALAASVGKAPRIIECISPTRSPAGGWKTTRPAESTPPATALLRSTLRGKRRRSRSPTRGWLSTPARRA